MAFVCSTSGLQTADSTAAKRYVTFGFQLGNASDSAYRQQTHTGTGAPGVLSFAIDTRAFCRPARSGHGAGPFSNVRVKTLWAARNRFHEVRKRHGKVGKRQRQRRNDDSAIRTARSENPLKALPRSPGRGPERRLPFDERKHWVPLD